jgi:hypothetical protein
MPQRFAEGDRVIELNAEVAERSIVVVLSPSCTNTGGPMLL